MDPVMTEDGKPYGPFRYKEIVKERYIISKYCNTSYTDLANVTPTERNYLLEFATEECDKAKESIENIKKANDKAKEIAEEMKNKKANN